MWQLILSLPLQVGSVRSLQRCWVAVTKKKVHATQNWVLMKLPLDLSVTKKGSEHCMFPRGDFYHIGFYKCKFMNAFYLVQSLVPLLSVTCTPAIESTSQLLSSSFARPGRRVLPALSLCSRSISYRRLTGSLLHRWHPPEGSLR